MAFQPIVDLQTNRIDAHEALVRGPAGEPAYSILSKIDDTTRYAFDQACRVRAIELAASLGMTTRLNINFLPNAVYDPRGCIRTTLEAAARTGFDPSRLTFEIVESEAVADTEHLLAIITEYRRQGFSVALDDFGAGYSNLARLAALQPDIVKVDRELIQDCDRAPIRLAIIRNLVSLARDINTKLVFEGVERAGELQALRDCGARFMQGYYFARPAFERILRESDIFPRHPASSL
jgi:EAL domain-containing protein (putative c-di-GMP-specific phosphodiesterase class I)